VTFGELRTLLVEIETTINNRPLTFIYDDEKRASYTVTSHLWTSNFVSFESPTLRSSQHNQNPNENSEAPAANA
jgi:hypothetical protein